MMCFDSRKKRMEVDTTHLKKVLCDKTLAGSRLQVSVVNSVWPSDLQDPYQAAVKERLAPCWLTWG